MSFENTYGLWHVLIGGNGLGGITRANVMTGTEVDAETTDGQVHPSLATIRAQAPRAGFDSLAIKTALGLCGMSGESLAESELTLWSVGREDGGQRALATSMKYTMAKGILVPERISAQQGGNATIGYSAYAGYDGTNAPLVGETGSAPDWTTPPTGYDERFTCGPCMIGGIACYGVRSIDIAFGFTVNADAADGDVWPRIVSISTCTPRITIRGVDLGYFGTGAIPLTGKACTTSDTRVHLRRRKANDVLYGDGESQHISISAPGLATIEQAYDASGQALAECTVTINCTYDGTNLPLVFNTATTVSMS